MVKLNKFTLALGAAVALLALPAISTPGFAQVSDQGDARVRAVEECSRAASKYKNYSWGSQEITAYRACMGERGQAD